MKKFTESTEFWSKLDFAYDLLSCVMRAARFFDTSSQVAAVHVYSMWSMLPESFKMAMAKHPRLMASNRDFYASVADLLVDRWVKFDKPVYSAAFLLAPYNYVRAKTMKEDDENGGAEVFCQGYR